MITNIQKYLPRWEGENRPYIWIEQVHPNSKVGWLAVVTVNVETPFGQGVANLGGQWGKTEEEALERLHNLLYEENGLPRYSEPLWSSCD